MTEYDGATSLQKALEQLHGKKLSFDAMAKITNKYRERLNLPTGKAINTTADKLKIYQLERGAITQSSLTELPPPLIEPATQSNLEPLPTELNNIQLVNDVVPTVEPVIELDIIHTQNDSKPCDKFISINYRHADNSRHTVQLEQFYIDALIAIGITDISKFVAKNAGITTVTKNVKRSIVNELVNRVTLAPAQPFTIEAKNTRA
ncbi:MAG: hypothetical protein WCJ11_12140 [Methylococcaceae bacterium]